MLASVSSDPLAGFRAYVEWYYPHMPVDDLVPTETPGVWKRQTPCGGRARCREPMHYCLLCEGPALHTICYHDRQLKRNGRGQFLSPYRTWRIARDLYLKGHYDAAAV